MARAAVLLRAVNVGGRRLTMDVFKGALADLGLPNAQTVVATGNAVVAAEASPELEVRLEAGLAEKLGGPVEVFVRSGAQLAQIVAANPFADFAARDPSHMVAMVLRGEADPDLVEALRSRIVGPEQVAAGPGCLFATYPDDIGHSKLTGVVIERTLKLRGTVRNWNTLRKLAEMAAED